MALQSRPARQLKAREGHLRVSRSHAETVTDTEGREHHIRLGVFRSNTRTRHDQQKLTPGQVIPEGGRCHWGWVSRTYPYGLKNRSSSS